MSLGKLIVSLQLDAAGYEQGTKEAAEAGARLEKRLKVAMDNISKYGTIAGGVLVTGLTAAFNAAVNRMDAFDELSERIGVSVDQLQRLTYAGQMTGVTQEDLASALQRVSVNAGKALEGNEGLAQSFKALRIDVSELKGLTPEQIFQRLADAVAGSNDSAERNAVLSELLGKNYSTLVPLLSQGAEGMKAFGDEAERFGLVTGPEAAKQAALFNDNLDRIKANALGLAQSLTSEVLPQVNTFVDRLFKARQIFGSLYAASNQLGGDGYRSDFGQAIKETNADLETARQRLESIESFQSRTGQVSPALERAQKRVDGLVKQLEFFKALQREEVLANKELQSADERRFKRELIDVTGTGGRGKPPSSTVQSDYEKFLKKVTTLNADVAASTEGLSRTEQLAARIRAEFLDTSVRLSDAERDRLNQILNSTVALDGYNAAQARAKDALTAFRDAQFKAEQGAIAQRDRQAEVVAQLERELEQIGMNADELFRLTDARRAESIALEKQKLAALEMDAAATQPEIEALREKIRLLERERQVRNSIFNKEASTTAQAEQDATVKRMADQVEQGVGEAFLLAVTGRGREASERLRKMFVETFAKDAFELILDIKAKNGKGGVGSIWDVLVGLYDFLGAEFGLFGKSGAGKAGSSKASSSKPGGTSTSKLGLDGASRLATISNVGPVSGLFVSSGLSSGSAGASAAKPTINYSPTVIVNGDAVSRSDLALALEENRSITMAQLADMVNRRDPRSPV
jgi:hypothetical protein